MKIDRCYCYDKTFEALKEIAKDTGASSIEELQEEVLFGMNCELCHLDVETMLDTGEIVFTDTITNK